MLGAAAAFAIYLRLVCDLLARIAFERTERAWPVDGGVVIVIEAQMIFTIVKAGPYG